MILIQPNKNPDAKSQALLSQIKLKLGGTPNIFKTLAHSSAALQFYLSGSEALKESTLSGALQEQIALTVAGANQCDYCASAHTVMGRGQKISDAELAANLEAQSEDAKTQAALTFAQEIVDSRGHVSDAGVRTVRAAGYSDREVVEIIAVVSHNIFTNYFNLIAGTAVDFPLVNTAKAAAMVNDNFVAL